MGNDEHYYLTSGNIVLLNLESLKEPALFHLEKRNLKGSDTCLSLFEGFPIGRGIKKINTRAKVRK